MDKVTFLKFLNGNDTIERLNDLYKFRNAKSIGMQSLNNMSKLKSINIPPNIQGELGLSVCQYNTVMEEAIISSNQITTLGHAAFSTNKLTSFVIPNSVTSLIEYVCYNCSLLEKLVLGKEIKNIHSGCFMYANLKDIYVDSLKHWFEITFSWPPLLTTSSTLYLGQIEAVRDPEKGNQIDHYKWDKLEQDGEEGNTEGKRVKVTTSMVNKALEEVTETDIYACFNMTQLEGELVIPNNVTRIGGESFYGCTGITKVKIGNSITNIEGGTFRYCTGLTSIEIPNSITSIGNDAFHGCTTWNEDVILNNINSLGEYAFRNTAIKSLKIRGNITNISAGLCYLCTSLVLIDFPDTITVIGNDVLYYSSEIKTIICRAIAPPTYNNSFVVVQNLKSIYVPDDSVGDYQTANGWSYFADKIKPLSEYVES